MALFLVIAIIMLFYFELLGQSINSILNTKNLSFNFVIGFFFVLCLSYIFSGLLSYFNCEFIYILVVNSLVLLIGAIFVVLKIKNIRINFTFLEFLLLVFLAAFSLYFTYNTSLGDLHGFDSTFYINMVVGPLNSEGGLYKFSDIFGFADGYVAATSKYTFQSYHGFCSSILWYVWKICNVLGKELSLGSAYVWIFQIIFTFSLISILINSFKEFNKKSFGIFIALLIVFSLYYLKVYFFNIYGFYGNSFRVIAISYACYFTTRFVDNKNINDRYLLSLSLIAGCAFTSSFLFFIFIYLFAYVLVNHDLDNSIFKWLAFTIAMPAVNLLLTSSFSIKLTIIALLSITSILIVGNNIILKIIKTKYVKISIIIVAIVIMFLMSLRVTKNLFDFSAFIYSGSESSDMTLNYFYLDNLKFLKLYMLFVLFGSMLLVPRDRNSKISWILILVLFNPFCCSYFKSINPVYYRAYDVILNPFLAVYYSKIIAERFNYNVTNVVGLLVSLVLIFSTNPLKPMYYHGSFIPEKNYNHTAKMTNTELDIIREIDYFVNTYEIKNPYICTPNILTFSSLGYGRYVYGREYWVQWNNDDAVQVHKMFRPVNYYGEDYYIPEVYGGNYDFEPDYKHAYDHLKKAGIDILVVSKDLDYYDEEKDVYYPIRNLVEWWYDYPDYENDDYCLYLINRK